MKLIENFIAPAYQDHIESVLLGDNFQWYLHKSTVSAAYAGKSGKNVIDSPQFAHVFTVNGEVLSQYWNLIQPLTFFLMERENVDTSKVARVKANINMQDPLFDPNTYFTPHIDCRDAKVFTTAIYYVNDADGDTLFFDKSGKITDRVTPKKGSLVYFDGHTMHAGQAPSKSPYRCLINFNFIGS